MDIDDDDDDGPVIWHDEEFSFARPLPSSDPNRNLRLQLVGDPKYFTRWEDGEEKLFVYWYGTTVTGEIVRVRTGNKLPYMYSLVPPDVSRQKARRESYQQRVRSQLQAELDKRKELEKQPWKTRCHRVDHRREEVSNVGCPCEKTTNVQVHSQQARRRPGTA